MEKRGWGGIRGGGWYQKGEGGNTRTAGGGAIVIEVTCRDMERAILCLWWGWITVVHGWD